MRLALGTQDELSTNLSKEEWAQIYQMCQQQAIAGVVLDGLDRLSAEQRPSQLLLLQWIGDVQQIEMAYSLQCQRTKELRVIFQKVGCHSSVLKGIGFSQYYSVPEHRQVGDIDLWVDGKRKEVMWWLRSKYEVEHIVWHHVDAKIFEDVETEIHFHPGWFYNPFKNRKLQNWFENEKTDQMVIDEKLGFAYPTVQFNAVYSLVHLYHHLIEEGVGIRHILDYYYILSFLPLKDRNGVVANLKRFEMMKLAGAMMWVLQVVCGMSSDYLICEPNEKEGRFLLDEIMRGGNFGKYRRDNLRRNTVARMFILLPHYPSEVLWVVPWKLWHKVWRMVNK